MSAAREDTSWNWIKGVLKIKAAQAMPENELANVIGILYKAGADTIPTVLELVVMASVLHPITAKKV
jgi:hypothetical protein